MFERLNTPDEAYHYKLGAALNMERTVLKILDANISEAQDEQVAALFREHREESEQHVTNLEEVFRMLGWEVDDSPCPAIDGIQAEGKANAKKTDNTLVDNVLLQGAVETEHHEIAVYENLIINARAMGHEDVVAALQRNLQSEQATLEKVRQAEERVAAVTPQHPAGSQNESMVDRVKSTLSS